VFVRACVCVCGCVAILLLDFVGRYKTRVERKSERERETQKPHKRKILLLFVRALGFHYAGAKGRRGVHVHTTSTPSNGPPLRLRLFDTEKHNGGPGIEVKRERERKGERDEYRGHSDR